MTKNEVYQNYRKWREEPCGYPFDELFHQPIASYDIFEDDKKLVNRLYYVVPKYTQAGLDCFIFYEENIFEKKTNDDLIWIASSFDLQND